MKRHLVYFVLAISVLINVGALAGAWFQVWRAGGTTEVALFGMGHERVPDYLKLDRDQRERWVAVEQNFVTSLNDVSRTILAHREKLVHEIFSAQPDTTVIERERSAIFALQEAQQRNIIKQLMKEREMLDTDQRRALAELLLKQGQRNRTSMGSLYAQ